MQQVDALEHAAVSLLLVLAVASIIGMVLATLGWFSAGGVGATIVVSSLAALVLGRRYRPVRPPGRDIAALAFVVLLFGAIVWPPAEAILGGWDTGAYLNTGASLARTGSFSVPDPFLSTASPEIRSAFVALNGPREPSFLPGFYFPADSTVIVPQLAMLLSLWIAIGFLAGGAPGGLAVAPAVGMLAVGLFFLLMRRAWSTPVGLAAALLLATNGVQIWHAQQTLSEELVQVFLFGGLFAGLLALRTAHPFYAGTSGLILALLPLVKTEGLVLAPLAVGVMGLALISAKPAVARQHWLGWSLRTGPASVAFFAGAGLGASCTVLHYLTAARIYATEQIASAPGYAALGFIVLLAGSATALLWSFRTTPEWSLRGLRRRPWQSSGAAERIDLLPRWLRPPAQPLPTPPPRNDRETPFSRAAALGVGLLLTAAALAVGLWDRTPRIDLVGLARALYLGAFLTPLDLLALGAGLGTLLLTRRFVGLSQEQRMVLTTLGLASLLYLAIYAYYVAAQDRLPLYMWATRRLVPTVLPLLFLILAVLLVQAALALPWSHAGRVVFGGLLAAVLLGHMLVAQTLLGHREFRGALAQISALNEAIPQDAVVIFGPERAGSALNIPLRFLYGRDAYLVRDPVRAEAGMAALRDWAASGNRPVYFVSAEPGRGAAAILGRQSAALTDRIQLDFPVLESGSQVRPAAVTSFAPDLAVFRLEPSLPLATLPVRIDVGAEDAVAYALLRDGWHGRESEPGGPSFRWTGAQASVALPEAIIGPGRLLLHLGTTERPPNAPPAAVTVLCGIDAITSFEARHGFPEQWVDLPSSCAAAEPRLLIVRTAPWSPVGGTDQRVLGVRVDWIVFLPHEEPGGR